VKEETEVDQMLQEELEVMAATEDFMELEVVEEQMEN
jgi:hypothetical protein